MCVFIFFKKKNEGAKLLHNTYDTISQQTGSKNYVMYPYLHLLIHIIGCELRVEKKTLFDNLGALDG